MVIKVVYDLSNDAIVNDLEWSLTHSSRSRQYWTSNNIPYYQLFNGSVSNDLERSFTKFQGHGVRPTIDAIDELRAQLTRNLFAIAKFLVDFIDVVTYVLIKRPNQNVTRCVQLAACFSFSSKQLSVTGLSNICRVMLCISAAYAVVWCLSVTFVDSVEGQMQEMCKSRDSLPTSGLIACCQRCDCQMLYTQLRRTMATLIAEDSLFYFDFTF